MKLAISNELVQTKKNLQFNYYVDLQVFVVFFGFSKTLKVELEGIEPSSKQVSHMLSTCLFCYWFL